jgi:hypothetical protein
LTLDDNRYIIIAEERETEMKYQVGDVVQMTNGYGIIKQIIGKNVRVLVSGQYGYGEWYTFDQIVSHAALSRNKGD